MRRIIAVFSGIVLAVSLAGQTRVVHGKLTCFDTYPVRNVEVHSKKGKSTTVTDSLGEFSIVCLEKDIIQIKPVAFRPVTRRVDAGTDSLKANLVFIDTPANRERAIGYGYLDKSELNYAVSNLQQKNNEYCSYTNIFDLIRGMFGGVTVSNNHVYIRGSGSFTGQTQALYIVNGSEVRSLEWLQPCEIESIDILKDSNAAIYGARGGNGVLIIKTRSR
jgi:TonB-dependent SusC/RagA subfamily outer membrane receptor